MSGLRGDLTSGVLFLANRPGFSGYCTGTPAIVASTYTPVTLDTETYDTWQGHSPLGSHPDRYYCQAPGWYLAEGYIPWTFTGGAESFQAAIGVNTAGGAVVWNGQQNYDGSGQNPGIFSAMLFEMTRTGAPGATGADYCNLQAFTSGAVSLAGSTSNFPRLSVRWVGTGAAQALQVPANAAFPVPPLAVDETWLNTNISDAIGFLANPPLLCYTYTPGSSTLASGTWPAGAAVPLNTSVIDNCSGFASNTWTVPAGCGGVYYAYGQVAVAPSAGSSGTYAAGMNISGTTTWGGALWAVAGSPGTIIAATCGRFRLAAGATVKLEGFQDTGGALALRAPTRLILIWESS